MASKAPLPLGQCARARRQWTLVLETRQALLVIYSLYQEFIFELCDATVLDHSPERQHIVETEAV